MSKGFTYRFIIYGVVVLYMLLDINLFKGPLYHWVLEKRGKSYTELRAEGVSALVYGQPIMDSQVEYEMASYLYKRGRTLTEVSEQEYPSLFEHCLQTLVTRHLLRVKTHHNEQELPPLSDETLSTAIENRNLQFSDGYERKDALRRQGYVNGELELRAEAHLQQQAYLNRQIHTEISEAELASIEREDALLPERLRFRHIFLSTWEENPEEVKMKLETEIARIESGELSFTELSDLLNEDERAKKEGGQLGWVTSERIPEKLAVIFTLPLEQGTLIQSSLGWHYIEVLEKKPQKNVRRKDGEVRAYLENQKRKDGLALYLRHLRTREKENALIIWNKEEPDHAQ